MAVVKAGYWLADGSDGKADSIACEYFNCLFCGFAKIDPATYSLMPLSTNMVKFSTTVKGKNPSVTTFLSIGGDPATLSAMSSSADSRDKFIRSSIKEAKTYGFDGLDLAWECPTTQSDMLNLGALVSDWRQRIATQKLLLTAAVYFRPNLPQYPADAMQHNLDWINVMAFDFVDPTSGGYATAGPAALNGNPTTTKNYCVKAMVDFLLGAGLEAKKLVLGLPFYGYGWRLEDEKVKGVGAKANGPALLHHIFRGDGSITFRTIKQSQGFDSKYDKTVGTDFAYLGTTWVGYDGYSSMRAKLLYAKTEKGLRGYVEVTVGCDTDNAQHAKDAFNVWDG